MFIIGIKNKETQNHLWHLFQNFKPFPADDAGQKRCRDSLLNYEPNDACHVVFPVLRKLNVDKCKVTNDETENHEMLEVIPMLDKQNGNHTGR